MNVTGLRAEFFRDEVLFFATYQGRANTTVVYKGDYIKFKLYPMVAQPAYISEKINRTNFEFSGFQTFTWNSSSVLFASGQVGVRGVLPIDFIFDFNPTARPGSTNTGQKVKFSIRVRST